ncbi:MAG: hypothetical protein LBG46_00955 [Elusimicrobiota bacterium]|jgi:predicted transcriptional regulator of viral defense system|nr:hypothetical protein [Elusimicrobiota bacterium]
MTKFDTLLLSGKNIFNIDDLSALWEQTKRAQTVWSIKQYVKSGKVQRLRRGLYAIDNSKLDPYILANKALAPSYITGLTVLQKFGLSFQSTNTIHSAAQKTKIIKINNVEFIYHGIKSGAFFNDFGLEKSGSAFMASKERAIADMIYLYGSKYDFERMDGVDWDSLKEISKIYAAKSVENRVLELERKYA